MVDAAHVRLVDPHPEGDGGDHDPARVRHPPLLGGGARLIVQPGVIGAGRQPGRGERLGQPLGGALQGDVDDGRAGRAGA